MVEVDFVSKSLRAMRIRLVGLALGAYCGAAAVAGAVDQRVNDPVSSVLRTWTGTSTCVGYRLACKNEEVVYRFVAVDSQPTLVRLLADRLIEGSTRECVELASNRVELSALTRLQPSSMSRLGRVFAAPRDRPK